MTQTVLAPTALAICVATRPACVLPVSCAAVPTWKLCQGGQRHPQLPAVADKAPIVPQLAARVGCVWSS